jgi:hypothetical protein
MDMEIAGHEWFAPDGKTIWFDLQQPRSVKFFVTGTDVKTLQQKKYELTRDEWSIHFNIDKVQKMFCGDGGDSGQVAKAKDGMWIYLFKPQSDRFVSEKLVNMKHHGYKLEPNVHFSPDGNSVIFRANFEGKEEVYAVEIKKSNETYQGNEKPVVNKFYLNHRTMKKVWLFISLYSSILTSSAQIQWPAITQQTKPWARWWWEGSAVDKKNITANMQDYKAAGLGGLEITPIYGVYGYENKFINFLSPQWMQMLDYTLKEAKRLGIGIDIANGTGWPFGGPWIKDKDASKTVVYKTYTLNSGEELKDNISYRQEGFVRTANTKRLRLSN